MVANDDREPDQAPASSWQWHGDWGPLESAAPEPSPQREATSRPGVPEPGAKSVPSARAPKSRPLGAVLVALVGSVLGFTWWGFWWEADQTIGTARTQFAWTFLYLGAATCVYLFFVWRWFIRR